MKLLRRKRPQAVEPAPVVDCMLAIYVHDLKTLLSDMPSGDRLKSIAAEALQRHDPT